MLSLASIVLALFPSVAGVYVHASGEVGSGGIEHRLTLMPDGTFRYASRGCFVDEARAGVYRRSPGGIVLSERPKTQTAWEAKGFRLVRARNGSLKLVDESRQTFEWEAAVAMPPSRITVRKENAP